MTDDLRRITWLLHQWRGYCHMLWAATAAVWVLCSVGILLLGSDELVVRGALALMLVIATACSLRLFLVARREARHLEYRALEVRTRLQEKQAALRHTDR